jgi:lysozyme family protein
MSNFKKWTDYIVATSNSELYSNADFTKASVVIDRMEGGYSTVKNDKGNYLNEADYNARRNFIGTNWGISAPTLASWRGRAVTQSEMKALTYDEALKIYKKWYWDEIGGDKILNDSVAFILYDSAVNQGVGGMRKVYKSAVGESYSVDSVNNYKE